MNSFASTALIGATALVASILLAPAAQGQELARVESEHQEGSEEEEHEEIIVNGLFDHRQLCPCRRDRAG